MLYRFLISFSIAVLQLPFSATAIAEKITSKELQAKIEIEERIHDGKNTKKSNQILPALEALREELRVQAVKYFGKVQPGNEQITQALSGIDVWIRFEWYVVAPYLANRDISNLPACMPLKGANGIYYPERSMLLERDLLQFVRLWRNKDESLQMLRDIRSKYIKLNKKFYHSPSFNYNDESSTFDRQLDLEFYLTDNGEHRDRLIRLGYKRVSEASEGNGASKKVIGIVPDLQSTHLWYEYHRWYYAKAAGSDAWHWAKRHAKFKPEVPYEDVKAFENEVKIIGMGDFLERWKQRLKKSTGLEK